jgi:hypothetical protein
LGFGLAAEGIGRAYRYVCVCPTVHTTVFSFFPHRYTNMPRLPSTATFVAAGAAWIVGGYTAISWARGRREADSREAWNAMMARDEEASKRPPSSGGRP